MWYNTIPDITFRAWFLKVLELFNKIMFRLMVNDWSGFFLYFAVFLMVFALLVYLFREGRKGRL